MLDALKEYCAIVHPGTKVSTASIWLLSLVATLTRDAELKDITNLMAYFDKFIEDCDPTETNELLGSPTTTLAEWSEAYREASRRWLTNVGGDLAILRQSNCSTRFQWVLW